MHRFILAAALLLPVSAFAAGSYGSNPPKETKTTKFCAATQIWDDNTQACVDAKERRLDDDTRYDAARELAYAGRYDDALYVLAAMEDQDQSRVLTYYGFSHRKAGRIDLGMQYYAAALAADPDNLLARSYMGQGLVESGDYKGAFVQLAEIRARGGSDSWPEQALAQAIQSGKTYNY